jgi:hypothetical protein
MSTAIVSVFSALIFLLLAVLGVETLNEFKRMNRHPGDFSGSDRLAGTGE